jgi:hypothetical protein
MWIYSWQQLESYQYNNLEETEMYVQSKNLLERTSCFDRTVAPKGYNSVGLAGMYAVGIVSQNLDVYYEQFIINRVSFYPFLLGYTCTKESMTKYVFIWGREACLDFYVGECMKLVPRG